MEIGYDWYSRFTQTDWPKLTKIKIWMRIYIHSLIEDVITHPCFNTLRPRQNGRHFPDVIFKCIFLNENVWISIKISLNFIPNGPIHNIPAMVQIMAWRRPGDKPLSEPLMVGLLTHICVTRPPWVNGGLTKAWLEACTVNYNSPFYVDVIAYYYYFFL